MEASKKGFDMIVYPLGFILIVLGIIRYWATGNLFWAITTLIGVGLLSC